MAIDTAKKRRTVAGIPGIVSTAGPGVTPNAAKDLEWRQQVAGSYIYAGQLVSIDAAAGLFTLEGQAVEFRRTLRLVAEAGIFSHIGQSAEFIPIGTGEPPDYILTALGGVFSYAFKGMSVAYTTPDTVLTRRPLEYPEEDDG